MIEKKLSGWDGKSADFINFLYECHARESGFTSEIIRLIEQEAYQKGATWLLKKYFEAGNSLTLEQSNKIYSLLPQLKLWEVKLHVLQCIPYMPIPQTKKKMLEAFLRKTLIDQNKFVRAWSYNGFYQLSLQYPEYQQETEQFFVMAMKLISMQPLMPWSRFV